MYTIKNIRTSTDINFCGEFFVFSVNETGLYVFGTVNRQNNEARVYIAMWALVSFCRFTNTNAYGTGSVKIRGVDPYGTGGTCPPNIYEGGTSMVNW